jgi:hypothetical protein
VFFSCFVISGGKVEPTMEQPTMEQPTMEQPTMEQPTMEQPTVERPTMEQLSIANNEYLLDEAGGTAASVKHCKSFIHARIERSVRATPYRHPLLKNDWPQRTHLACWHDTEPFDTLPVPMPRRHDRQRGKYYVFGIFCSLNCAKKWMLEHPYQASDVMLFAQMAREVFGVHDSIPPAPPVMRLQKFGGDMTLEQLRSGQIVTQSVLRHAPFASSPCVIEEIPLQPAPPSSNVLDESDRSEPAPFDAWMQTQPVPAPPPPAVPRKNQPKRKVPAPQASHSSRSAELGEFVCRAPKKQTNHS